MNNDRNPVIITENDFLEISSLIGSHQKSENERTLIYEMDRAILVKKDAFPTHTIGLNSRVTVINTEIQQQRTFQIVMPALADSKLDKVSILSPMGTALIGFRKGEEVVCKMPEGLKKFLILDVVQQV